MRIQDIIMCEVKIIRKNKKINATLMAEKLCICCAAYNHMEKNNRELKVERYIKICEILNLNPGDFLNLCIEKARNSGVII